MTEKSSHYVATSVLSTKRLLTSLIIRLENTPKKKTNRKSFHVKIGIEGVTFVVFSFFEYNKYSYQNVFFFLADDLSNASKKRETKKSFSIFS